jgi:hypothetical protein
VPLDSAGELVGSGDAAAQATRCLGDLRHLTIHVVGEHQNLLDVWSAVLAYFAGDAPPATLLGANLLGYSTQLVEFDATVLRSQP